MREAPKAWRTHPAFQFGRAEQRSKAPSDVVAPCLRKPAVHSCECNEWAIHTLLKGCDLELLLVLNFEELPFAEENAGGSAVSAAESAGVGDFEPKLIDSQALDFCVERLRRDCQFGCRARWP